MSTVLTLNPGSSSIKASVRTPEPVFQTVVERIDKKDLTQAVISISEQVRATGQQIRVIAHRVVHGGPTHYQPTLVDDGLLADLRAAIPLAPLHLPGNLLVIEQARRSWPDAIGVACFDTGFHAELPEQSTRLPVPAELVERGVRRYGFHGLSISSVLHRHPELGQAVIAHLGSGCSVTAVADGRPRHTTMSLSPTGGMVSGTRPGDLDPEIVLYLTEQYGYRADRLRAAFNQGSGLAGIASGRHDLRDLLAADDPQARLAIDIFVSSAAMAIASCATTLDNWQTLVFTGGIGEHAAQVRDRICARLLVLRGGSSTVDTGTRQLVDTGLAVLVVPADEEAELDRLARQLAAR